MYPRHLTRALAALITLSAALMLVGMNVLPAWSDVYKCADGKGGVLLKNRPCDTRSVEPNTIQKPNPDTPTVQPIIARFEGRVVEVLDERSLRVIREGKPVTVRIRDMPSGMTTERVRALAEHESVIVLVYSRAQDGTLLGEVILPSGRNLSQEIASTALMAKDERPFVRPGVPSLPPSSSPPAPTSTELQSAQVSQDKIGFCQSYAQVVHVVAMLRDKGVTLSEMLAGVRNNPPHSPQYVLAVNEDVVRSIYAKSDTNPATIALRSFTACITTGH